MQAKMGSFSEMKPPGNTQGAGADKQGEDHEGGAGRDALGV